MINYPAVKEGTLINRWGEALGKMVGFAWSFFLFFKIKFAWLLSALLLESKTGRGRVLGYGAGIRTELVVGCGGAARKLLSAHICSFPSCIQISHALLFSEVIAARVYDSPHHWRGLM